MNVALFASPVSPSRTSEHLYSFAEISVERGDYQCETHDDKAEAADADSQRRTVDAARRHGKANAARGKTRRRHPSVVHSANRQPHYNRASQLGQDFRPGVLPAQLEGDPKCRERGNDGDQDRGDEKKGS